VIGVPTNQSDFYGKYLIVPNTKSAPSPAYKGTWDMAGSSWGPDWYGNSAVTSSIRSSRAQAGSRPMAAATSVTSPAPPSTT
jgi:hypothetical protein